MADKKLTEVDVSTTIEDTDSVISNIGSAVKQITLSNLVSIIKEKIGSLKNPYKLTFTGAVSETYDGSVAKTINIPAGGSGDIDLSDYQTKTDNTLTTTSKDIVGAINENKDSISQLSDEKITNPTSGTVGQVLAVKTVDDNGKPTEYETVEQASGSSYELPIATSTQLGGVMPVAKTDEMTQEVGVDELGGLFTIPSKSDVVKLLDVTLAESATFSQEIEGLANYNHYKLFIFNCIDNEETRTTMNISEVLFCNNCIGFYLGSFNPTETTFYVVFDIDNLGDIFKVTYSTGKKNILTASQIQSMNLLGDFQFDAYSNGCQGAFPISKITNNELEIKTALTKNSRIQLWAWN